jgi:hypothetical protein
MRTYESKGVVEVIEKGVTRQMEIGNKYGRLWLCVINFFQ